MLYGGSGTGPLQRTGPDFKNLVYTPSVYTVELNIAGKTYKAVMKELQFNPVTDALQHIDFMELRDDKPVVVEVPVKVSVMQSAFAPVVP